jgi:EAL and modified HD-GYP domain-containing signal transduction protein
LLAKLQDPDATAASLEALAIRDASLTYRILRIVNAAAQGFRRKVDTLSQAITLLGTEEITRWVNLFLVENEPGKPGELTRNMLVRARMCEILAELGNRPIPVNHFIVGLLSQLDVLMDISMEELMEQVPLGPEVKLALLQRAGSQGEILAEVERYEQGRFSELNELFNKTYYEVAYRHASAWARQVQFELHG